MKNNKKSLTSRVKKDQDEWHTNRSSIGMGDYYGTGVRAKLGRVRNDSMGMTALKTKKLKTSPRSLA